MPGDGKKKSSNSDRSSSSDIKSSGSYDVDKELGKLSHLKTDTYQLMNAGLEAKEARGKHSSLPESHHSGSWHAQYHIHKDFDKVDSVRKITYDPNDPSENCTGRMKPSERGRIPVKPSGASSSLVRSAQGKSAGEASKSSSSGSSSKTPKRQGTGPVLPKIPQSGKR